MKVSKSKKLKSAKRSKTSSSTLVLTEIVHQTALDGIEKIVAGAVVTIRKNHDYRVLLLERAKDDFMGGLVELPSGGIEKEEDPISALRREINEETGLNISDAVRYIGSFDYRSASGKKARQLNFLVSARSENVSLSPAEHSRYFWLTADELEKSRLPISKETKEIVLGGLRALDGS